LLSFHKYANSLFELFWIGSVES